MRRREVIAGLVGAAAWPLAARAQREEPRRLGVLFVIGEGIAAPYAAALREGLRRLVWTEGGNLQLDLRFGGGDAGASGATPRSSSPSSRT